VKLGDLPILMRKDRVRPRIRHRTYILERAQSQGALVVNDPASLRDCNERLFTAWFPQCTPPTLFSRDAKLLRASRRAQGRHLQAGRRMAAWHLPRRSEGRNLGAVIEELTRNGARGGRRAEISSGDQGRRKRILVVDGKPIVLPRAHSARG